MLSASVGSEPTTEIDTSKPSIWLEHRPFSVTIKQPEGKLDGMTIKKVNLTVDGSPDFQLDVNLVAESNVRLPPHFVIASEIFSVGPNPHEDILVDIPYGNLNTSTAALTLYSLQTVSVMAVDAEGRRHQDIVDVWVPASSQLIGTGDTRSLRVRLPAMAGIYAWGKEKMEPPHQ